MTRILQEELKELKQNLASMQESMDKGKSSENALNSKQIELKNNLEESEAQLQECRAKVARWNKSLKHLKCHKIDGEPTVELAQFTAEELEAFDIKELKLKQAVMSENRESLKPNMAAISEYRRKVCCTTW